MVNPSNVYTIKQTTCSEIAQGHLNMGDLISDKINGFIVSDFLSETEVSQLLNGLGKLNDSELTHIEKGFDSYPMSFAQYDQMLQRDLLKEEDYFSKSEEFISSFTQKFGIDILSKMNAIFSSIKNAPKIEIPKIPSTQHQYSPFTFRELFPGDGCLKAHCENLFFQEFPSFFSKINAFSTLENQLSFFIVLQRPEVGGELTLFDIIWNENQQRIKDTKIKLENNVTYEFDNATTLKRDYYHPPVGSLVVFSGGKIWHRVEKVIEAPSRITLGGFLSFSHDKTKLYTWS